MSSECSLKDKVLPEIIRKSGADYPSPSAGGLLRTKSDRGHSSCLACLAHARGPHCEKAVQLTVSHRPQEFTSSCVALVGEEGKRQGRLRLLARRCCREQGHMGACVQSGRLGSFANCAFAAPCCPSMLSIGLLGVVSITSGPAMSLWEAAAREGFSGVTSDYLSKMIAHLQVFQQMPADRPRSILAKIEALIKHILPHFTT